MANYPYPFSEGVDKFLRGDGTWQTIEIPETEYALERTYAQVKSLRDTKSLIPGLKYRITDYTTTTSQTGTQAAGHDFDIIVEAVADNELSERAWAVKKPTIDTLYLWEKYEDGDYASDSDYYQPKSYIITDRLYRPGSLSMTNYARVLGVISTGSDNSLTYDANTFRDVLVQCVLTDDTICPNAVDMGDGKELRVYKNDLEYYESGNEDYQSPDMGEWYSYIGEFDDINGIFDGNEDYFANADLNAWEIWYCLDNDTTRFAWASGNQLTLIYGETSYVRDSENDDNDRNGVPGYAWYNEEYNDRIYTQTDQPEAGNNVYVLDQDDAWDLMGTVDNIIDSPNGKGVIYYMKDEWGNECPYDFKNIQFNCPLTGTNYDTNGTDTWVYTFNAILDNDGVFGEPEDGTVVPYRLGLANTYGTMYLHNHICPVIDGTIPPYFLPANLFLGYYLPDSECAFSTYNTIGPASFDNKFGAGCINNFLEVGALDNVFGMDCTDNVVGAFSSENYFADNCMSNTLGDYAYHNTFGASSNYNTLGINCSQNSFGTEFSFNRIGDSAQSNTFGNSCNNNTLGNNCVSNTFGRGCTYNTLRNDCSGNQFSAMFNSNTIDDGFKNNTFGSALQGSTYNVIGKNCTGNTFGGNNHYNNIGHRCQNNVFGTDFTWNRLGDYCIRNHIGNSSQHITFGTGCQDNYIGNNCTWFVYGARCVYVAIGSSNSNLTNYAQSIILDPAVSYIYLTTTQTTSSATPLRNIYIYSGVVGTNSNNRKTITHPTVGDTFSTEYKAANSQIVSV